MCGIAGIHSKKAKNPVPQRTLERMVDQLLLGIEDRGKHATGVLSITNNAKKVQLDKLPITASKFIGRREDLVPSPRTILLHTRWWTQGHPDNPKNNHPLAFNSCFVVHNGHINNDDELFEQHKLERKGEVDSEAIAAMIHKYGFDHINNALHELEGNYAIATVDPERNPNELILAKGPSSPLMVYETDDLIVWASEKGAIERAFEAVMGEKIHWADISSLNEGELLWIKNKGLDMFEFPVKKPEVVSRGVSTGTYYQPTGAKPKQANEPKAGFCKGCNHPMNDHPHRDPILKACIGSKKCNCRKYVSHWRADTSTPAQSTREYVAYVGVDGFRCGLTRDGRMFKLGSGEELDYANMQNQRFSGQDKCVDCTHGEAWHVGMRYNCDYPECRCQNYSASEQCMVEGEQCETVEAASEDLTGIQVQCESCNEWVDEDEMERIETWQVCGPCFKWFNEDCADPTDTPINERARVETQYEELMKEETKMHTYCLDHVVDKTGNNKLFIEWLLFRAPQDMIDDDKYLEERRSVFDTLYADAEDAYLRVD